MDQLFSNDLTYPNKDGGLMLVKQKTMFILHGFSPAYVAAPDIMIIEIARIGKDPINFPGEGDHLCITTAGRAVSEAIAKNWWERMTLDQVRAKIAELKEDGFYRLLKSHFSDQDAIELKIQDQADIHCHRYNSLASDVDRSFEKILELVRPKLNASEEDVVHDLFHDVQDALEGLRQIAKNMTEKFISLRQLTKLTTVPQAVIDADLREFHEKPKECLISGPYGSEDSKDPGEDHVESLRSAVERMKQLNAEFDEEMNQKGN